MPETNKLKILNAQLKNQKTNLIQTSILKKSTKKQVQKKCKLINLN